MASTDAFPVPRKNVAYRVTFPILDADGDLVASAAGLSALVSKDAGTFAASTNTVTQIATTSGVYFLDLTATEMNADTTAVIINTSTTGAKSTAIVMYPEELGDYRVDPATIWTTVIENARTALDVMKVMFAALSGKASGLAGTTAIYRNNADTVDRITATVDASGNRSAVTLNLT